MRGTLRAAATAICLGMTGAAQTSAQTAPAEASASAFSEAVTASKSSMMADPKSALNHADRAATLAGSEPNGKAIAYWLQAEALTRIGETQKALTRIDGARRALTTEGDKLEGDILLATARAANAISDESMALSAFQDAYRIFTVAGEDRGRALALQGIAVLYQEARRYERAIDYYEQAQAAYADPALNYAAANNRAKILREVGRSEDALAAFTENLAIAERIGQPYFLANANVLLADHLVDRGDLDRAARYIAATRAFDDDANAALWLPPVLLAEAKLAAAQGDAEGAKSAFTALFEGYDFAEPQDAYLRAHKAAEVFYGDAGDLQMALTHLRGAATIEARVNNAAATNNFNLLNAEFEAANRDLELAAERSARLEAEVAAQAEKERLRGIIAIVALLAAALVLLILLAYLRSANRAREALAKTNAELIEASEAKTKFLASTSHEIRTPLNAIIGFCEIMSAKKLVSGEAVGMVNTVWTSGKDLLAIVNDILDLAKMEDGAMTIETVPCDITRSLKHVAALHRANADKKGLAVELTIEEGLPSYVTDEHRVRQAVNNLVGNAVKFTAKGAVTIDVKGIPAGGFEIQVKDTGIGIPSDQIDKVFESFTQVEGQRRAEYGGTGLGLALVRNVAQLLGGEVAVESKVGYGSTFTLTIPAQEAPPLLPEAAPTSRRVTKDKVRELRQVPRTPEGFVDLSALRILYAEDNNVNALVLKGMIGDAVESIEIAQNGAEAVEAVQHTAYDLVLMDNQMPVMGGKEAASAIRELPDVGAIPIIGCTADAAPAEKKSMIDAGMNDVVDKPVTTAMLISALERAFPSKADDQNKATS